VGLEYEAAISHSEHGQVVRPRHFRLVEELNLEGLVERQLADPVRYYRVFLLQERLADTTIRYGDGSTASGSVGTDNLTIGGLVVKNQAVELASTLSAQFAQGPGDGLLGLAWVSQYHNTLLSCRVLTST